MCPLPLLCVLCVPVLIRDLLVGGPLAEGVSGPGEEFLGGCDGGDEGLRAGGIAGHGYLDFNVVAQWEGGKSRQPEARPPFRIDDAVACRHEQGGGRGSRKFGEHGIEVALGEEARYHHQIRLSRGIDLRYAGVYEPCFKPWGAQRAPFNGGGVGSPHM